MNKQLKNYKLSCVGLDDDNQTARMVFFVYGVEGVENARRIVRKDNARRRMMRQHNVDWKMVDLHAVRCNSKGEVADSDLEQELSIMSIESAQIESLLRQKHIREWVKNE